MAQTFFYSRAEPQDGYDGLGDLLEEANDDFNDDTFGDVQTGAAAPVRSVGKDFDFFGQTAKVSDAFNEEQARFNWQKAPSRSIATLSEVSKHAARPSKTVYDSRRNSGHIPDLQVNQGLWGLQTPKLVAKQSNTQPPEASSSTGPAQKRLSSGAPPKKMMSVEEVEASMQSLSKKPGVSPDQQPQVQLPASSTTHHQYLPQHNSRPQPLDLAWFPPIQHQSKYQGRLPQVTQAELSGQDVIPSRQLPATHMNNGPQILQRGQPLPNQASKHIEASQPRQILQNPRRQQAQLLSRPVDPPVPQNLPRFVPASPGIVINQGSAASHRQNLSISEAERAAILAEDAKRAKRNHKIFLLSKDNGLMTPQDKNFVTRIQLQQLMTATGNGEHDPDSSLSEDFYYQVHSQIRGGPRQNPQQPLSHFAQTYLLQTGGRQTGMSRRHNRGGDNHMQRMEQQVQRAVEAAKLKPKNKQLVIEGSLGKITFSNSKTPKPMLNIKRSENGDSLKRPQNTDRQPSGRKVSAATLSTSDRKTILRNIEKVYSTLMRMEDHERRLPPLPPGNGDPAMSPQHVEWHYDMRNLNAKLWHDLKVLEPIRTDSPILHPFIAFLSYSKGKKAIPRIFRHIDQEQRLTIITMIVIHLNVLDVIRLSEPQPNEAKPTNVNREEVELFSQAVMPNLFAYVNDAPISIVIGLLGLILDHVNTSAIVLTKVGLDILTMLISRAELVKQGESPKDEEWNTWLQLYNRLFDTIEPVLANIFPGSINAGQDEYVWRFLAASGIGASPDQQQRLVIAVK